MGFSDEWHLEMMLSFCFLLWVNKGMLPVKYFGSNKASLVYIHYHRSNFLKIKTRKVEVNLATLSFGILPDLIQWCLVSAFGSCLYSCVEQVFDDR